MIRKSCDILFVPVMGVFSSGHLPYAALSLIGYIHKHSNFSANILDLKSKYAGHDYSGHKIDMFFDNVVGFLQDVKPRFVGFSSFTTDYHMVMQISKYIKERINVKIIVGGVHSTLFPQDFIFKNSPVDISVIGEGEETIIDIMRTGGARKPLSDIKGISFYDYRQDRRIQNESRELIKDLDRIPRLAYEYIEIEQYLKARVGNIRWVPTSRGVGIYTGRGCPFACEFCAANTVWEGDVAGRTRRNVRFRSLDHVFEEIDFLRTNYNLRTLYIMDDTFSLKKERVKNFSERISAMNILWAAETRCGLVNDEMVEVMKKSGCIQLDFGVESGSQRMLDAINKKQTIKEIERAFDACRRHGMRAFANILINIPGEEKEDIQKSDELLKKIRPDELSVAVLTPYPGTPIFAKYIGKLEKDDYNLLAFRDVQSDKLRLSNHRMNLQDVQNRLFKNNMRLVPTCFRVLVNPLYLKYLITSPDRFKLIKLIITFGLPMFVRLLAHAVLPEFVRSKIRKILIQRRVQHRKKHQKGRCFQDSVVTEGNMPDKFKGTI